MIRCTSFCSVQFIWTCLQHHPMWVYKLLIDIDISQCFGGYILINFPKNPRYSFKYSLLHIVICNSYKFRNIFTKYKLFSWIAIHTCTKNDLLSLHTALYLNWFKQKHTYEVTHIYVTNNLLKVTIYFPIYDNVWSLIKKKLVGFMWIVIW